MVSMNERDRSYGQNWLEHVEEGRVASRLFGIGPKEEEILVEHAEGGNS
jgi:hypothetical protein